VLELLAAAVDDELSPAPDVELLSATSVVELEDPGSVVPDIVGVTVVVLPSLVELDVEPDSAPPGSSDPAQPRGSPSNTSAAHIRKQFMDAASHNPPRRDQRRALFATLTRVPVAVSHHASGTT
jgi:hypothetical protein